MQPAFWYNYIMVPEDSQGEEMLFKPIGIRTINSVEVKPRDESPKGAAERLLRRPIIIHLFTDGPDRVFDPDAFAEYLGQTFGPNFTVLKEGDIMKYAISHNPEKQPEIVSRIAGAKLAKLGRYQDLSDAEKTQLEEEAVGRGEGIPFREFARSQELQRHRPFGDRLHHNDYYELSSLGNAFYAILPDQVRTPTDGRGHSVVVVTGRGVANKEGGGIHMRGGFSSGNVAVTSTTGLVEAPGKPLELEHAYQSGAQLGGGLPVFDREEYNQTIYEALRKNGNVFDRALIEQTIQEMFGDRMLRYEDPRLNEAVKGITLSMIFSTLGEWGKASQCSTTDLSVGMPDISKTCRMHDAHWQEEVIATQIKKPGQPEFCDYHTEIFDILKEKDRQ